jgi:hypothetical protein
MSHILSHILFHPSPRLCEIHQRLKDGVRRLDEQMRRELKTALEEDKQSSPLPAYPVRARNPEEPVRRERTG